MAREARVEGGCPPSKKQGPAVWGVLLLCCLLAAGAPAVPTDAWAAASGQGRYGAPLRFDPPPVELEEPAPAQRDVPVAQPPAPAEFSKPASAMAAGGDLPAPTPGTDDRPASSQGASEGRLQENIDAEKAPNAATAPVAEGKADAPAGGAAAAQTAGKPKPLHLFGYVEFRGPLKNLPKWERVLGAEKKNPSFGLDEKVTLTPAVAERWAKVREGLKDAALADKLKAVNTFFNQWPYKEDMLVWRVEDYWATPSEFVRKSGDCEDFAIAKYYALRSLGVPASQMRVVAVMEKIRNIGHAVLVVYMNDNAYVLDNLTNLILSHSRLTNYEPKFSVNEEYRWAHVKPVSGAR